MELKTTTDDYCLTKILCAAKGASVSLKLSTVGTDEQDTSFNLINGNKVVSDQRDIIKSVVKDSKLYSHNGEKAESIDSWITWCWDSLEVPLQVLLAINSTTSDASVNMVESDKDGAIKKATNDIEIALKHLESHLLSKTFTVDETATVADIVIACVVFAIAKMDMIPGTTYPAIFRWSMTMNSMTYMSLLGDTSINSTSFGMPSSLPAATGDRFARCRIRVKELMKEGALAIGKSVCVKGWVRTSRTAEKGAILFIEINDGSSHKSIQTLLEKANTEGFDQVTKCGGTGASLSITGKIVPSPAKGQTIELRAKSVKVIGPVLGGENNTVGAKNYPLAKKAHSLEFLRDIAHLRPRSKLFSATMRVRHAMAYATHKFFNDKGFLYVHTPLITAADCEGAGEQFCVTTLLPEHGPIGEIPITKKGDIDYTKDFFGKRTCLTVSGQLNVETHCCALSDVYTFGPTFRAENSHTSRHLSEFWMIEPEIAFADLGDDMCLAEDYVKFCTAYALEHCSDDLHYFEHEWPKGEKGLYERLKNVVDNDFMRITYTEAVELLQSHVAKGKITFNEYPNWGDDLGSEHERYICEKVYNKPTVVINYPKGIKAFYMKLNDDKETVAAMDVLVPKIGELIGGSQREDDLEILERRCVESGLQPSDIWWYADLRKYGTVPHAGFGLGFERLIMFVTGVENIRDVIPFPRVPGRVDF